MTLASGSTPLVAVSARGQVPASVGVPAMTPEKGSRLRPCGRASTPKRGSGPPGASRVVWYATPTGRDGHRGGAEDGRRGRVDEARLEGREHLQRREVADVVPVAERRGGEARAVAAVVDVRVDAVRADAVVRRGAELDERAVVVPERDEADRREVDDDGVAGADAVDHRLRDAADAAQRGDGAEHRDHARGDGLVDDALHVGAVCRERGVERDVDVHHHVVGAVHDQRERRAQEVVLAARSRVLYGDGHAEVDVNGSAEVAPLTALRLARVKELAMPHHASV